MKKESCNIKYNEKVVKRQFEGGFSLTNDQESEVATDDTAVVFQFETVECQQRQLFHKYSKWVSEDGEELCQQKLLELDFF